MEGNLKKKFQVLRIILSYADSGPPKLMAILSLYTLSMFIIVHFLSLTRNGGYELSKQWCVIVAICAIGIEAINQISYYLAKRNRKVTVKLKGVIFWLIFTIGMAVYIYLLIGLEKCPEWTYQWNKQIAYALIYLSLSWTFPFYGFSPDIRFLLLYGKFTKT